MLHSSLHRRNTDAFKLGRLAVMQADTAGFALQQQGRVLQHQRLRCVHGSTQINACDQAQVPIRAAPLAAVFASSGEAQRVNKGVEVAQSAARNQSQCAAQLQLKTRKRSHDIGRHLNKVRRGCNLNQRAVKVQKKRGLCCDGGKCVDCKIQHHLRLPPETLKVCRPQSLRSDVAGNRCNDLQAAPTEIAETPCKWCVPSS